MRALLARFVLDPFAKIVAAGFVTANNKRAVESTVEETNAQMILMLIRMHATSATISFTCKAAVMFALARPRCPTPQRELVVVALQVTQRSVPTHTARHKDALFAMHRTS